MPEAMRRGRSCERCHERWAQSRGLCRRCARELGYAIPSRFEVERAKVERAMVAAIEARVAARRTLERQPIGRRIVRIGDEVFEVVWDGS